MSVTPVSKVIKEIVKAAILTTPPTRDFSRDMYNYQISCFEGVFDVKYLFGNFYLFGEVSVNEEGVLNKHTICVTRVGYNWTLLIDGEVDANPRYGTVYGDHHKLGEVYRCLKKWGVLEPHQEPLATWDLDDLATYMVNHIDLLNVEPSSMSACVTFMSHMHNIVRPKEIWDTLIYPKYLEIWNETYNPLAEDFKTGHTTW